MNLDDLPDPLLIGATIIGAGLLPLLLSTSTAFVKISVVFAILRNALGLQQTPSNMIINAGALVLTLYIMYPVMHGIGQSLEALVEVPQGIEILTVALPAATDQMRNFMLPLVEAELLDFFVKTTARIWPPEVAQSVDPKDMVIVLPAFFLSELQRALDIGIIIFIPFLVIDLVVANTLMALGMVMVTPTPISLPLKLLFFVGVSGWTLITERLLSSYAVGS